MTNREYMINLLLDGLEEDGNTLERVSFDDCGASEESMIYYNINCPYKEFDKRCHCRGKRINREICTACKWEWLDQPVDE